MSKLNEEKLLYYLNRWVGRWSQMVGEEKQAYQQIRELIKIFFAKEISEGPIKKDIPQVDLIKWLQGINQSATAVKDFYTMKATTQLIELLQQKQERQEITEDWAQGKAKEIFDLIIQAQDEDLSDPVTALHFLGLSLDIITSIIEDLSQKINKGMIQKLEIDKDWLPTAENINVLPEPVRKYIADLETNVDPPSMVQENALLRDTCRTLEIKLEEKIQIHDELLIKYTEKFREYFERGFSARNHYKGLLKEFSQEAGLEIVRKK